MHRSKKKRNIIIFSLVGILLCMVAGYAAFQTKLEIKGTSKVTSNWNILITNVTAGTPTSSAENAVAPKWDKLTASMEANLYDKGDAMEYDVTIENQGTIDAKLNDILTNLENSNSEAVLITFSGYTKGEILKAGESKLIHVKIEYNPEYEGGETSSEVTLPEINVNDESATIGWYESNNKVGNPGDKYTLKNDITLIAKAEFEPIIQSWPSSSSTDFHAEEYRANIITATFLDNREVPNNAVERWDVSANDNGRVMAWVIADESDSTKYH